MEEKKDLLQIVKGWMRNSTQEGSDSRDFYCGTRDVFQARLDRMVRDMIVAGIAEEKVYLLSAVCGEVGNNSFDHNTGNWPGDPGVFFGYEKDGEELVIVLADKGLGILKTLSRVRPELQEDADALQMAFTEKISGRAPENRGNGLKFVRQVVSDTGIQLDFSSGNAVAHLNGGMNIELSGENIGGCFAVITVQGS